MEDQFGQINKNFEKYRKGAPDEPNPIFPEYTPKPNEPPRPPRPASVYVPSPRHEDRWERYVEDFIRKYQLDPGQRDAAHSYLRGLKRRAADHRASKAKEFKAVQKRLNDSFASGDLKKRAAAGREERTLNGPIADLFKELES